MLKIIILSTIILCSLNTMAQGIFSTVGGKAYLGISAGPSFPVGSFGDNNPQNERSGYAKTGYMIELNGGIRLLNLLEISVMGFRNSNGTDLSNLISTLNSANPGANLSGESDAWAIYGALAGVGISYPLPANFIADVRVLGGYLNTSSPEISLTGDDPGTFIKIEENTVSSPVYFGSASVRFPLSNRLYLNFGFQYIASSSKFKNVKTMTSIEGEVTESTSSFDRTLDTWGLNVGFKFFIL